MILKRYEKNPILKPTKNWWEERAAYNPGAVVDKGKTKILYRALGDDNISRFGYAESKNGLDISFRKEEPVYESPIDELYERLGVEDARITKINKQFYITYCASSLYSVKDPKPPGLLGAPFRTRVAFLSTTNFIKFNRLGIIMPNINDKDALLFPEKIDGKYVMLHRRHPDIWIAYSKDLKNWTGHKKIIFSRPGWESRKIGAGTPPLKTDLGWLLFYHGVDEKNTYRIGIMLLDLKNPEKVAFRTKEPVLMPKMAYEKEGLVHEVPEVIFASGLVERNNHYFLYYGASDRYTCVAYVEKDKLLKWISQQ